MKGNLTYLLLIGVAAAIVALFIFPYFRDIGHPQAIIPIFVVLALLFIYGRHNPQPKRRPKI
jgi:hypothetical protein